MTIYNCIKIYNRRMEMITDMMKRWKVSLILLYILCTFGLTPYKLGVRFNTLTEVYFDMGCPEEIIIYGDAVYRKGKYFTRSKVIPNWILINSCILEQHIVVLSSLLLVNNEKVVALVNIFGKKLFLFVRSLPSVRCVWTKFK